MNLDNTKLDFGVWGFGKYEAQTILCFLYFRCVSEGLSSLLLKQQLQKSSLSSQVALYII